LSEPAELKHRSGKPNESSIRLAFTKLLGEYAKAKDLRLVPGVSIKGRLGTFIHPCVLGKRLRESGKNRSQG